ncbi:MATE family multidrug resistance protein [Pseudovirgaria hyperparasitica]|uniref:MATE family multidrug resistance protein n=1 Tax=Pseudovirgaria hyperparasitica TaxID=470096 RepID=A0A6A6VSI7_9PEZI|nr:MATE family multidrug resistance protein [Pseudovirgaria hyperparasitica]KAF2752746.1 MATE family multidrug resistance protein [Pseudovirgaria hyperparasitica]
MSEPPPVRARGNSASHTSQLHTYLSSSPIAAASIAQDISDQYDTGDLDGDGDSDTDSINQPLGHCLAESYRRPSYIATGPRSTITANKLEHVHLSKAEREVARNEERSLLRDNNIIPPKHPRRSSDSTMAQKLKSQLSFGRLRKVQSVPDEESRRAEHEYLNRAVNEDTPLIGDPSRPYGGIDNPSLIDRTWESAVLAGKIQTTWQRESKVLARYSRSLILTFLLQYSLTVASIFTVGHIGKVELGAVSLASMTANITGYAVYQGLATSLDTLAAQAYGSGHKKLVGLQLQRMVYFLWTITIPIAIIWLLGTQILEAIVPEKETARLAGLYLKILLIGAPGYAAFESGKRYVQAQGLFSATTYVLLICAPTNALMNYLFVWVFGWGFVGAPIAVAVTENLLPLCLFIYVYFVHGMECWGGFSKRAFRNWWPMIKLALPGLVMVLAEFLAFEILTLSASWFSTSHLAAQSILSTVAALTFQIPFPMSIAASTRIANLIGATLAEPARMAAKVAMVAAVFVGVLNTTLLSSLKAYIPRLFTSDPEVIDLVAGVLPICAAFQLFDSIATNCNGILRGLGRQEIGGYVSLFAYYIVGLPISFGTAFGLGWELHGLWAGPAIGLAVVALINNIFIWRTSWDRAVQEAKKRNSQG